jgi:hypothetical protein
VFTEKSCSVAVLIVDSPIVYLKIVQRDVPEEDKPKVFSNILQRDGTDCGMLRVCSKLLQ